MAKAMTIAEFVKTVRTPNEKGLYQMFSVRFIKADKSERQMTACCGVKKNVKNDPGTNGSWNRVSQDTEHQVLTCYDMNKVESVGERGAFRRINLKTLLGAKVKGVEYTYNAETGLLEAIEN